MNDKLGVTSVVVTHEMDSAFRIADRMVLLDRGKFIACGTADEMRNSTNPIVHQFVNGLAEGPLTEIGGEDLVHVHVDVSQEHTGV